jgi:hypothetical protein
MEEKIAELYESINFIGFESTYKRSNKYVEQARSLFPAVQEFAEWFLSGNRFGITDGEYTVLQRNLIGILQDCAEGLEQGDRVLLMDALEEGLSEYLRMFISEERMEGMGNAGSES